MENVFQSIVFASVSEMTMFLFLQVNIQIQDENQSTESDFLSSKINLSVFTVWNSFGVSAKTSELITAVHQKVSGVLIAHKIIEI